MDALVEVLDARCVRSAKNRCFEVASRRFACIFLLGISSLLLVPRVLGLSLFEAVDKLPGSSWYAGGWLAEDDLQEMKSRRCSVLFIKDKTCSCADRIITSVTQRRYDGSETILANSDWRLIKDPKMKPELGEQGLHYTAWSMDPELRTVGDLRERHLPLLRRLLMDGGNAVLTTHTMLRREDLSVFMHFPPNIFRLHVHFVHCNASMWAPRMEIVPLAEQIRSLEARRAALTPARLGPSPALRCLRWT
eukprot:TRINITY_DN111629_c0_g1_i1.p1 TRINITY_DN111629_c0_g1~~TRINITY_DN111629_c0_g1_i1.p1  ORF type:complete len:249 (-),score=41.28 TRINITY_DN111629_c0_g1_i1:17-763(-)